MRPREIREFGLEELAQKEGELVEELFRLKLRKATGQLDNPMRIRAVRHDLARIKTVRRERTLHEEGE
jgi:large subunit ribosomal protein L29